MSERKIIIIRESIGQSIARDFGTFAMFAGLIGIGVILGSSALQAVGAVIGFLAIGIRASGIRKEFTREQAIKYLQEMEG